MTCLKYHFQISDNKLGIKLCIKKSDAPTIKQKSSRKRSRKSKARRASDSDDSDYEKKRRKELIKQRANNNTDKDKKDTDEFVEPEEQSCWGSTLPKNVLHTIFLYAVQEEGCLPTLINLGKVCSLWYEVSLNSALWHTLDLSAWVKDRFKTELKLKWFIENRFRGCQDVNVSNWKVSNVQCVLEKMVDACPNLVGITLAGWKFLLCDHLSYIVENFKKLQRLDLSSINLEANANKTAVGFTSLCNAIQGLNERLTHLLLAHNKLGGLPQIISALSVSILTFPCSFLSGRKVFEKKNVFFVVCRLTVQIWFSWTFPTSALWPCLMPSCTLRNCRTVVPNSRCFG